MTPNNLSTYKCLESELRNIRIKNEDNGSSKEDETIDKMEVVWNLLTEEEVMILQTEEEVSDYAFIT